MTFNRRFVQDVFFARTHCCALGLVHVRGGVHGFVALHVDENRDTSVDREAFEFRSRRLRVEDFDILQMSFIFHDSEVWHALVNPSSPVVLEVLKAIGSTGDHFIILMRGNGSVSTYRAELSSEQRSEWAAELHGNSRVDHERDSVLQGDK